MAVIETTPPRFVVARALLIGAVAGTLSGQADLASTVFWLAPGVDRARLAAVLLLGGYAVGALLSAAVSSLDALLARWERRAPVRMAALVALPLASVAHALFTGGRMKRLPTQWLLQPLTAVALVTVCAFALAGLRRFAMTLPSRPVRQRALIGAVSLFAGWALHGLDHRVFPRLYEYLHTGLGVATLLANAFAVAALTPAAWWIVRSLPGAAAVAGIVAALAAPWAWGALDRWPNVRAEVFGVHAPFVRHAAFAVASVARRPEATGAVDSLALRRARYARERAARADLNVNAPSFPGAHVFLFTVDAMRADRLGRTRAGRSLTPTLDGLAAQGVVFVNTYAQAPHSSYSLSSLHTGEYLHETLALGQPQPLATLADVMRANGRETAALFTTGIFFTEGERLTGYREHDFGFARATHVDRNADEQATAAIGEIDDIVRRGEPPSLMWVHFFDAHAPYQGSGPTPVAQYDDAVSHIDAAMGRVLTHARRVFARELVVAVTADHGEEFGDHGGVYHGSTLYEEQVRVPLVISAPGLTAQRVTAPVELVDVAPTLAALGGARPAPTMRGRDLRGWMLRPPTPGVDSPPVFSTVNSRKMVRRGQWKLVADLTFGVYELFDLTADPGERRNLAGTELAMRESLHADMTAWLESLADRGTARGAVARARVGDRAAIPGLTEIVRDPRASEQERTEAVELLASFARRSLIDTLRPILRDRSAAVRNAAAVALGAAGDASAAPLLRDLVTSDDPLLRRRAALALARLGDHAAVDALIETLWSPEESQVIDAIRALGALADPRAIEPLMTIFPDDHVRYQVVLALGQMRDPSLFELLARTAINDPTDDARANAIAALGMLGDRRAVPLILSTIRHTRAERYAAEALGALGVVGPRIEGFDARTVEITPDAFESCGPHEDTLGWRYLGAHSCIGKAHGGRLPVTFYSQRGGLRLMVIRARRDDGPPVRVPLRLGARVVATIPLSPRWEESRVPIRIPAGDVVIHFDLDAAGSPAPVLHLDHIVSLPAR